HGHSATAHRCRPARAFPGARPCVARARASGSNDVLRASEGQQAFIENRRAAAESARKLHGLAATRLECLLALPSVARVDEGVTRGVAYGRDADRYPDRTLAAIGARGDRPRARRACGDAGK